MSSFKPSVPSKPEAFTLVLPGTNKDAHELSEKLLTKNNKEFDIFFNEKKFHNHFVHHLLAAYSFGANKEKLQEIFEIHAKEQRPPPASVGTITRENYKNYLGKAESYSSFLVFFKSEIDQFGMLDSVRRWVWHGDFLARVMGGIFHPVIHIGYGIEFELPGVVSEGLSMMACTSPDYKSIIPELPDLQRNPLLPAQAQVYAENAHSTARGFVTQLVDQLSSQISSSLGLHDNQPIDKSDPLPVADIPSFLRSSFLLELFVKIKQDPVFNGIPTFDDDKRFGTLLSNQAVTERIKYYVQLWPLKESTQDLQAKFTDLHLFTALALGSTGIRDDHPNTVKLDFFMMHGLTSSEFIHQYISRITPSESILLLRAQLASIILVYLFNSRPTLNIEGLLAHKTSFDKEKTNNHWMLACDKSLDCEEAHVIKAVRSCAVGQTINGPHQDIRLNEVWLKVANMCIDKNGDWEFAGVGFDETWK
ncbi:unnamed protein product [Rhizopus stolonifer]